MLICDVNKLLQEIIIGNFIIIKVFICHKTTIIEKFMYKAPIINYCSLMSTSKNYRIWNLKHYKKIEIVGIC